MISLWKLPAAYITFECTTVRIAEDLQACDFLLRELGAQVVGFRAPGYEGVKITG